MHHNQNHGTEQRQYNRPVIHPGSQHKQDIQPDLESKEHLGHPQIYKYQMDFHRQCDSILQSVFLPIDFISYKLA